jgi:hypothetical protein
MLTVDQSSEEVSRILKRYSAPKISDASGIPLKTIYRIRESGTVGTLRVLRAINVALASVEPKAKPRAAA